MTSGFQLTAVVFQVFGEEDHRWNADSTADQQRIRPLRPDGTKPQPMGPITLSSYLPAFRSPRARKPSPTILKRTSIQSFSGVHAHDRERSTHRDRGVTLNVNETPGHRICRRLWCAKPDDELVAGKGCLTSINLRIFDEQRAAIPLRGLDCRNACQPSCCGRATICCDRRYRHADCHAVFDLLSDDGFRSVGQAFNFYATVHWAGMHDDRVGFASFILSLLPTLIGE